MKSIAILVPYFGRFPSYFEIWKKTVLSNSTIDFYIISDCVQMDEGNVRYWNMGFTELKERIQAIIPYKIALDTPYKISNFRPVFGMVFQKELRDYDFWGTCEMDMLLGDLRSFWTEEILENYEKIGVLGHLQLYKNNSKINNLYNSKKCKGAMSAKKAFTNPYPAYFEEICGMHIIAKNEGIKIYNKYIYADVVPFEFCFYSVIRDEDAFKIGLTDRLVFTWKKGHLYQHSKIDSKEIIYAHFQKRHLAVSDEIGKFDSFIVSKNCISFRNEIDEKEIMDCIEFDDQTISSFYKEAREIKRRGRIQRYCSLKSIINTLRIKKIMKESE